MQVCHACGNECADTAKFCSECGTRLVQETGSVDPVAHGPSDTLETSRTAAPVTMAAHERAIRVVEVASQPSPAFATPQTPLPPDEMVETAPQTQPAFPPVTLAKEGDLSAVRKPALIGALFGVVVAVAAGTWLTQIVSRTTPHIASTAPSAPLPSTATPARPSPAPTGLPAYAAPSAKVMARAQAPANAAVAQPKTISKPAIHPGTMSKTPAPPTTRAAAAAPALREHTRPVAVATAQPDAGKNDWYTGLKAELNSCNTDQSGFFARMVCKTRAQNRYCNGHWNAVPECPHTVERTAADK